MAPKTQFILRKNLSFNIEEATFVVQKYGGLQHITLVRRAFATKFHPKCPRNVPQLVQFERLLKRFEKTGTVHHTSPPRKASTLSVVDDVEKVREYFFDHLRAHIRSAVTEMNMSYEKIWNILKKTLRFKVWIPKLTQELTPAWCTAPVFSNIFNNLSNCTSCGTFLGHFG